MSGVAQGTQRAGWLRTLLQWHWISSALCLVGIVLFSITGITLNHASQIEAKPVVVRQKAVAPKILLTELGALAATRDGTRAVLPPRATDWIERTWGRDVGGIEAEWSADEIYLPLPRPGGDAWMRIGLADGASEFEVTSRGAISWLNDLHKGRHTGVAWSWFLDLFAVACLVFAVTGFLILKLHSQNRPVTWPLVGFGLLLPAMIAMLFIH
ncbi:MAG: PepSY-associated TM helix domain-containing protein [Pseudomonadota bacterium]